MWVVYSERPLRAEELCHALGVEIGATELDPENFPAMRTLLASCLGLLTVESSSSIVRLVHLTLHEYLTSNPTLLHRDPTLLNNGHTLLHSFHSTIAEACLTYLNFGSVRGISPTYLTMPLQTYASACWGEHARRGMTESVKTLALRLLGRFDEHQSAQIPLLYHCLQFEKDAAPKGPMGFTGLHRAAYFG